MKSLLSCGKLQRNRHQGIPRQAGVSSLANPKRLRMGALFLRGHTGAFPFSFFSEIHSQHSIRSASGAKILKGDEVMAGPHLTDKCTVET